MIFDIEHVYRENRAAYGDRIAQLYIITPEGRELTLGRVWLDPAETRYEQECAIETAKEDTIEALKELIALGRLPAVASSS